MRFLIWALLRENDKGYFCEGSRICNDHPFDHADDCPVSLLKDAMVSAHGILLDHALNTDFALSKGFTYSLDDVPADEYNVMRLLQAEQNKHEREQIDKDKR